MDVPDIDLIEEELLEAEFGQKVGKEKKECRREERAATNTPARYQDITSARGALNLQRVV